MLLKKLQKTEEQIKKDIKSVDESWSRTKDRDYEVINSSNLPKFFLPPDKNYGTFVDNHQPISLRI